MIATSKEIESIHDQKGDLVALVIRSNYMAVSTEFYTPDDYSQQLGIIKYPGGHIIKQHYHSPVNRIVTYTQEVLVIRKGRVKAMLYDSALKHLCDVVLHPNDVLLLASGGHGFEMLDDAEMLEIKQGPYLGSSQDKKHF